VSGADREHRVARFERDGGAMEIVRRQRNGGQPFTALVRHRADGAGEVRPASCVTIHDGELDQAIEALLRIRARLNSHAQIPPRASAVREVRQRLARVPRQLALTGAGPLPAFRLSEAELAEVREAF
jgi:hypothetical protein